MITYHPWIDFRCELVRGNVTVALRVVSCMNWMVPNNRCKMEGIKDSEVDDGHVCLEFYL